ncbi:MAG: hypothetical protein GY801_17450 [bacterium]|nr:hypothetical protein [bacterium]
MIKKSVMSVLILLAAFLSACSTSSLPPNGSIPAGAFKYTAYDGTGARIVEGWFTLVFKDAATVEGEWNFKAIGDPQKIGPQVGEGELRGQLQDDNEIIIDLHPGWADNNVVLNGPYSLNEILGNWAWSTIVGPTNQGTFTAVK